MWIQVSKGGWGVGRTRDIRAVLDSAHACLDSHFTPSVQDTLVIVPSPPGDQCPRTYYREDKGEPIRVQLSARDRKWAKFAYQFSHELSHVFQGYERLKDSPNNWFHESICELASLFTLRSMAKAWREDPPYPNWADYSKDLWSYAGERLGRPEHQLPSGISTALWLESQESGLRKDPYQREKNGVIAGILLPLFEDRPEGWNTIRALPHSSSSIKSYLLQWREMVEPRERGFVEHIGRRLEQ